MLQYLASLAFSFTPSFSSVSLNWYFGTVMLKSNVSKCLLLFVIILILDVYCLDSPKPIPNHIHQTLFEGITYQRDIRKTPRPIIIHLVKIDLTDPKIRFLVTPGAVTEKGEIGARTTRQFLTEFNLQLAINGSYFYPFRERFWNAYPRQAGDPVYVVGFASSRGQVYSQPSQHFETFYISADNQAQFQKPIGAIYNAISGGQLFLKQGKVQGCGSVRSEALSSNLFSFR